jgi:hypothetical protein
MAAHGWIFTVGAGRKGSADGVTSDPARGQIHASGAGFAASYRYVRSGGRSARTGTGWRDARAA